MSNVIKKDLLPGLSIAFGADGTWLHFETPERSGAFSLDVLAEQGHIAGESVASWCATYRKQLEATP